VIWALYLLFLAGALGGGVQAVRLALANRAAGRPEPRKPGWHEDLP
jgi:hypothetical protein